MISGWAREVAGWILVAAGAALFAACYFEFLRSRKIFEAGPMAFMGFVVFRGGIHLLKVAIAVRLAREAARDATPRPRLTAPPPSAMDRRS